LERLGLGAGLAQKRGLSAISVSADVRMPMALCKRRFHQTIYSSGSDRGQSDGGPARLGEAPPKSPTWLIGIRTLIGKGKLTRLCNEPLVYTSGEQYAISAEVLARTEGPSSCHLATPPSSMIIDLRWRRR
jgi:hypothetical protein